MCDFCENGKFKPVDGYDTSGLRTVRSLLAGMIGEKDNGIVIDKKNDVYYLMFDNSSGEYTKGAVEIAYCPLCNRKLSEETEKQA